MSTPMTRLTDREIDEIARRIAGDILNGGQALSPVPARGYDEGQARVPVLHGVFGTVAEAVQAAGVAQKQFVALPLATRAKILEAMRASMLENGAMLAKAAYDETGYGRYEDKIVKNRLVTEKTPGLEDLAPIATSGDHGLTLVEPAPFGVIGAITPVTNRPRRSSATPSACSRRGTASS